MAWTRLLIQVVKTSILHRISGHSLRLRVRDYVSLRPEIVSGSSQKSELFRLRKQQSEHLCFCNLLSDKAEQNGIILIVKKKTWIRLVWRVYLSMNTINYRPKLLWKRKRAQVQFDPTFFSLFKIFFLVSILIWWWVQKNIIIIYNWLFFLSVT